MNLRLFRFLQILCFFFRIYFFVKNRKRKKSFFRIRKIICVFSYLNIKLQITKMDYKTDVLQMIKDGMSANPYFATHVLLVVLDKTSSSDHQKFFCSLANITFDVKYINPMGREQQLQLIWECKKEKSSSHVYWCSSIYNDTVISECTKQILSNISESLEIPLKFLVTTPLNFKEADKLGRFECIASQF